MGRHRSENRPDYVLNVINPGDIVHPGKNGVWYLYKIPDTPDANEPKYWGRIMPGGILIPSKPHKKKVQAGDQSPERLTPSLLLTGYTQSQETVWEFGFTHFMLSVGLPILQECFCCDAENIIRDIILSVSPKSYLQTIPTASDSKCQLSAWKKKLCNRLLECDSSFVLTDIYQALEGIKVIKAPDLPHRISSITEKQNDIFQRWNVAV